MRSRRRAPRRALTALTLAVALFGILATAAGAIPSRRLVWNASASAPIGLYWRIGGKPAPGDLVLAWAPLWARRLADERRYLPMAVPLIKRVAAVDGDTVCAEEDAVKIDGVMAAHRRALDALGRFMPNWTGCQTLGPGEVFLLMAEVPDSYDGRYFGISDRYDIIGLLVPLWTR